MYALAPHSMNSWPRASLALHLITQADATAAGHRGPVAARQRQRPALVGALAGPAAGRLAGGGALPRAMGGWCGLLNTLLALPSVVVGLLVYLLLSRSGPLGSWGILFTPTAMVIAQSILVVPLIAALTRRLVADALAEGGDQLRSLGAGPLSGRRC
jgi:hypothetical protein